MDSKEPLISIVIPTYNRADLIVRSLRSIEAQTYQNIEVVVVDDGSTDTTAQIIKEFKAASNRIIKYIYKENGGCASACNTGIKNATAEIFGVLASDDEFIETAVESMVTALLNTNADYVYSPIYFVYSNGKTRFTPPVAAGKPDRLVIENFKNPNVSITASLFRKKVIEKAGYLDESLKYNEDSDFYQRVALHYKAAYSNIPTVRVYLHANNKSKNRVGINKALLKSAEGIITAYPEFAHKNHEMVKKRIKEIKINLIEALIKEDNFAEARFVRSSLSGHCPILVEICLRYSTKKPILFFHRVRISTIKNKINNLANEHLTRLCLKNQTYVS